MKLRALLAAALTLLLSALVPGVAAARGGFGSSSFHSSGGLGGSSSRSFGSGRGLGGGGHFFFFGGGHGGGTGGSLLVIVVIVIVIFLLVRYWPAFQRARRSRAQAGRENTNKTAKRERQVELAAAEAAEDDARFNPDTLRMSAKYLFVAVQKAWNNADRAQLHELLTPRLAQEWDLRLQDMAARGWHNHVQILDGPEVNLVGLVNREGEANDQVVVQVKAKLRDYVVDRAGNHLKQSGQASENVNVREFWTLKPRGDEWQLDSIEQGSEGAHALRDKIVATDWSDREALHDESMVELANADAAPAGTNVAELAPVELSSDAQAAARDMGLADARFSPDMLEIAARRAVDAWSEAIDGSTSNLEGLARPDAVRKLLYPLGPDSRLVVRGPEVKQIRIVDLDPRATPPTMGVSVEIRGRRYLQNRATAAIVAGSDTQTANFTEHWLLALDGDEQNPWQIVRVQDSSG